MPHTDKPILVTGATGHQGGAVARHLLLEGWPVRAMTRNPNSPEAEALAARGAQIVQADMDDPASLPPVLKGAYGVFSVQNFWQVGYEREISEGKALAEAARRADVAHFIYSSVGGAERKTGVSHFESKWQIEQHIAGLDMPHTIFRPVFFMDNFLGMRRSIRDGKIEMALRQDTKLQMIAVDDIGAFVTMAFDDRDKWLYTQTELAGDELTIPQVARRLSAMTDREVRYVEIPMEQALQENKEQAEMWQWFNDYGYEADIAWLREQYPPLRTFDQWVEQYWPVAVAV